MRTYEELKELMVFDKNKATHGERTSFGRSVYGGYQFYGKLLKEYPIHYRSFMRMHIRHNDIGVEIDDDFSKTGEGMVNFIFYLGDVPSDMIKPSIGRINHSKGYIKNNFRWQSKSDNNSESSLRGNPSNKKHQQLIGKLKVLSGKIYLRNLIEELGYSGLSNLVHAVKYHTNYMVFREDGCHSHHIFLPGED